MAKPCGIACRCPAAGGPSPLPPVLAVGCQMLFISSFWNACINALTCGFPAGVPAPGIGVALLLAAYWARMASNPGVVLPLPVPPPKAPAANAPLGAIVPGAMEEGVPLPIIIESMLGVRTLWYAEKSPGVIAPMPPPSCVPPGNADVGGARLLFGSAPLTPPRNPAAPNMGCMYGLMIMGGYSIGCDVVIGAACDMG